MQSLHEFINDLDLLLTRISKENKKCYIMADWNIDLMKHQSHDNVSKALDFILFADDTNIFFSHNDSKQLMEIANNKLKKLSSWFQANKRSINIKKIILFYLKQNKTIKTLTYIFQLMI